MKAKDAGRRDRSRVQAPAPFRRTWEMEAIGAVMALAWLLGALQFIHHMI